MNISVGTKNPIKLAAAKRVLSTYPGLSHANIIGIEVDTGASEQPLSLEETVRGAKTRAENSFIQAEYSIGLESGVIRVDGRTLDVCVCSVYDGEEHSIGLSCAFELPDEVVFCLNQEGCDLEEACFRTGISDNPNLGKAEGAIGVLTKGRINRKQYTEQALITALIKIEYKKTAAL